MSNCVSIPISSYRRPAPEPAQVDPFDVSLNVDLKERGRNKGSRINISNISGGGGPGKSNNI